MRLASSWSAKSTVTKTRRPPPPSQPASLAGQPKMACFRSSKVAPSPKRFSLSCNSSRWAAMSTWGAGSSNSCVSMVRIGSCLACSASSMVMKPFSAI